MSAVPTEAKIYHITHIGNLAGILRAGHLFSDARRIELGLECYLVGMSNIKQRRLNDLTVTCSPGTTVGQYVPFYFCPRSIMLYLLYMGNHPDLHYKGGQHPIVHLQADLNRTICWTEEHNVDWVFSVGNAGSRYAPFYNSKTDLERIDWPAVMNRDFRDPIVKEAKQSEFLVFEAFPWQLIEKIGVIDANMLARVAEIVENQLELRVEQQWYY
jgi:hypothetical protein